MQHTTKWMMTPLAMLLGTLFSAPSFAVETSVIDSTSTLNLHKMKETRPVLFVSLVGPFTYLTIQTFTIKTTTVLSAISRGEAISFIPFRATQKPIFLRVAIVP